MTVQHEEGSPTRMSETQQEMQARLSAAMHRIADALQCMRGPTGELIYVGEKAPAMAWHLARAGLDVVPDAAIIKRRAVPPRPGQFAGLVDWVPITTPDPPPQSGAELVSASDGVEVDLDALEDALPWHVRTKIKGAFN